MEKLNSITKSTYLNEGLRVLERIKDENYQDYHKLMKNVDLNQNSKHSRSTCWSQIKKRYLDFSENSNLLYSPAIKLFNNNILLKKELMYLNYIYTEPTFRKIIMDLIYPKLIQNNGETSLSREEIVSFLDPVLDYSRATINKTARSSAKALIDFSLAEADGQNFLSFY